MKSDNCGKKYWISRSNYNIFKLEAWEWSLWPLTFYLHKVLLELSWPIYQRLSQCRSRFVQRKWCWVRTILKIGRYTAIRLDSGCLTQFWTFYMRKVNVSVWSKFLIAPYRMRVHYLKWDVTSRLTSSMDRDVKCNISSNQIRLGSLQFCFFLEENHLTWKGFFNAKLRDAKLERRTFQGKTFTILVHVRIGIISKEENVHFQSKVSNLVEIFSLLFLINHTIQWST